MVGIKFHAPMPEHPEIRSFVNFINLSAQNIIFTKIIQQKSNTDIQLIKQIECNFKLEALQRGKQLKFNLYNEDKILLKSIIFGLGITGYFQLSTKVTSQNIISFEAQNFVLGFRSENLSSIYVYEGDFDLSRSPDPIYEEELFLAKLRYVQRSNNVQLNKEYLAVFLLDQKYFNGVGNYLRCELLHRLDLKLDVKVSDVDLEEIGLEVIALLQEAFEVTSDYNKFSQWLQCYGKAPNRFKVAGKTLWSWKQIGKFRRVGSLNDYGLQNETNTYLTEKAIHLHNFLSALRLQDNYKCEQIVI